MGEQISLNETNKIEYIEKYDFRTAIMDAANKAPLVELTDSKRSVEDDKERTEGLGELLKDEPDEALLYFEDLNVPPSMVSIFNEDGYLDLVMQCTYITDVYQDADFEDIFKAASDSVNHELQHAAEIQRVNPELTIRYNVYFLRAINKDGEEVLAYQPSVSFEGVVRKIDFAAITAAPEELGEGDLHSLHSLGYESPEEVFMRRNEIDK